MRRGDAILARKTSQVRPILSPVDELDEYASKDNEECSLDLVEIGTRGSLDPIIVQGLRPSYHVPSSSRFINVVAC